MVEVIKAEDIPNLGDYDIDVHNAIIVPKGATNGDMLIALFGENALITLDTHNYLKNWWNAPYKGE